MAMTALLEKQAVVRVCPLKGIQVSPAHPSIDRADAGSVPTSKARRAATARAATACGPSPALRCADEPEVRSWMRRNSVTRASASASSRYELSHNRFTVASLSASSERNGPFLACALSPDFEDAAVRLASINSHAHHNLRRGLLR